MKDQVRATLARGMLAAAIGLALVACGRQGGTGGDPAKPAADAAAAQADDGMQAQVAKMNGYIECFNAVDATIHRGVSTYTKWMRDPKAGPSGKEDKAWGPGELNDRQLGQCREQINTAAAAKPALAELDAAAREYLASLEALAPLLNEAQAYYSRDSYKEDGLADGRRMHAPLMQGYARFASASAAFEQALDVQNDALTEQQISQIEAAEGKSVSYYRLSISAEAKRLVNLLTQETFDPAQGEAQTAKFRALIDEAYKATEAERKANLDWDTFEGKALEVQRRAKERVERVRNKTPYSRNEQFSLSSGGTEWMVQGSPQRLLHGYNELVFASNRL